MKEKLTNQKVNQYQARKSRYAVFDTEVDQLWVRVEPSGKKCFYVNCYVPDENGVKRRSNRKIGDVKVFTVAQARDLARQYLSHIEFKGDPKKKHAATLGVILKHYEDAGNSRFYPDMINIAFSDLKNEPVDKITQLRIEKWRQTVIEKGSNRISTINKKAAALKTLFAWATKRKLIKYNPLAYLKKLPETDSEEKMNTPT